MLSLPIKDSAPVEVVSVESSFSKLKIIKNYHDQNHFQLY